MDELAYLFSFFSRRSLNPENRLWRAGTRAMRLMGMKLGISYSFSNARTTFQSFTNHQDCTNSCIQQQHLNATRNLV